MSHLNLKGQIPTGKPHLVCFLPFKNLSLFPTQIERIPSRTRRGGGGGGEAKELPAAENDLITSNLGFQVQGSGFDHM